MKVSANNLDENKEIQTGPKIRSVDAEQEEIHEEKPAGADVRLKAGAAGLLLLVLIIGIKGSISNGSLQSKIDEQQKALTEAQAEALLYGITEDEDGELVAPSIESDNTSVNVSDLEWNSIEERNTQLLASFSKLLLNWKGQSGYNRVRQTLINDWGFTESSRLLTSFMPELDEDLDANMSLSGYSTFVLTNDGKNMSYFLICTVRNTINGTSASGTVGIHITINEDGTVSNVTAQTLR